MNRNRPIQNPSPSQQQTCLNTLLPLPAPSDPVAKTMLVILRRMAVHGLRDAHASHIAFGAFGKRFEQVLTLSRCLLHETALASRRSINIASCCTPRMTRDEALMMSAIVSGDKEALSAVTDNDMPARALSVAICLKAALDEVSPKRMRE